MFSNEVGQGDGHGGQADSGDECDSDNDSLPEINNRRLVEIESSSDEESSEDEESQSENDSIPDLEWFMWFGMRKYPFCLSGILILAVLCTVR